MQFFYKFGNIRKEKRKPLEAQNLNFRVLMDCSNKENLKSEKLKEALWLSVYKNILVI